ncbi:TauD/TfdA family dioxygenase [Saccharopolyspora erythraea]|uniref:TauD/TfdA family dioxygenase n=1 Tax=Saccharopolyspora erythraea TaxID=1836 RepID=UPI001BA48900|nr:TauD/TfdA family dioxygenase [Saccharopolyspora erythraea]QUG99896.1 TauD/TfdA family dioxygenase [Saccharopolyspora erythraea]
MLPTSSAVETHRIDITTSDGHSTLVTKLAADGIALIEGVHDQASLLDLARSLGTITQHRDSTADGVTTIANLGKVGHRSGFAGFSTDALNPHTDRSGVPNPPSLLLMACRQPAATGGECIAIDGQAVHADLAETEPEAVHALSQPRSALFGGAAGHLGAVFERSADALVALRLRLDELAQFAPEVTRWLPALRNSLDRHAMTFTLDTGHGYILNNRRWLHDRRAFTGHRRMYRVNLEPLPRLGIPAGFTLDIRT